jgi:hypothetical protein
MDYKKFKKILNEELPINRKEKFYTATILPSLLFHNGRSNFYLFLKQIINFPTEINERETGDNFLFYTEYNLKQSAGKKSVGIEIETDSGETPDVLIEIFKPRKILVIIEAKMFQNLTQNEFSKQMKSQRNAVIKVLKKKFQLHDDEIFHIGLVPKELNFYDTLDYQIINWEILNCGDFKLKENYFYNFLRFALENYSTLVADKFTGQASTVKGYIKGSKLYDMAKKGEVLWIGRKGGKSKIQNDVLKGIWRNKDYCWNDDKPSKGIKGNWISNDVFASIIDAYENKA